MSKYRKRGLGPHLQETLQVKQNLSITVRERGKLKTRHRGHNIWLNLGREYLASLIAYSLFSPLTAERDDRIRYMGFGIGGNRQIAPTVANNVTFTAAYPGGNTQTDTDPAVIALERPVRISGGTSNYPSYGVGDVWAGQIVAPPDHVLPTQTTFSRLFSESEISYGPYTSVPLSEVALFTNAANPNVYNNTAVAYDTFDTISKTTAFTIEIAWTIIF